MTIPAFTKYPSTDTPGTFADDMDTMISEFPAFISGANAVGAQATADAATATTKAGEAAASAASATAATNVTKWVSGTIYTEGDNVWSPIDFITYRRKTNGGGTTDPNADSTNWSSLSGASLAANTFTDTQNLADNILQRPVIKDYGETINAIGGTGGGTQDIDLTLGNVVTATVDTSTNTFTFSNPSASGTACSFTLILTNGGSRTVNWPASVDWPAGTAPTLTASGVDVLAFVTTDGGTTWRGFAQLDVK